MAFLNYVLRALRRLFPRGTVAVRTHHISSRHLKRRVRIDIYLPPVLPWRPYRLALFNDGQDLPGMDTARWLKTLHTKKAILPCLVVGIYAADRLREYGTAGQPDYKGRGDLAFAYREFLIRELLPYLNRRYRISADPNLRALAGFSLGGLSAFDTVWKNAKHFGIAGVFSGSLWWRSRPMRAEAPDADLIAHAIVAKTAETPPIRAWFMAGTEDETSDRNHNGIIDAIDDTLQLVDLLEKKGLQRPHALHYRQVEGGRHEPATWAEVLPEFLTWAFPMN
jgi:enterochelin esterase-like enzyme